MFRSLIPQCFMVISLPCGSKYRILSIFRIEYFLIYCSNLCIRCPFAPPYQIIHIFNRTETNYSNFPTMMRRQGQQSEPWIKITSSNISFRLWSLSLLSIVIVADTNKQILGVLKKLPIAGVSPPCTLSFLCLCLLRLRRRLD